MSLNLDNLFAATNISATGLTAERTRMEVVANNIANAYSTRSANGGPFRRQDVVFASVMNDRMGGNGGPSFGGVQVVGIEEDSSPFVKVHNPGHPDCDGEGFVLMPNVQISMEMVNLITTSRAYETNLRALQSFRQMAEQALTLARNG